MNKHSFSLIIVFLSGFFCSICAQNILLDDSFTDWQSKEIPSFKDKSGDANTSGIDFTDIKISNDDRFLFLYFDLSKEINLQQNNFISLYIDMDDKSSTGLKIYGIGADLVYYFGPRNGKFYLGNASIPVFHNDIGLVTSPTVTSHQFEICIRRIFSTSIGQGKISDQIKIVLSDENIAGDKAPDQVGGYPYIIDNNKIFTPIPFSIQKEKKDYLRILSYNVLKDRMFLPQFAASYDRVFKATQPDIIGFCEIYDNSSAQTAAFVESILPSIGNQKWYHMAVSPDIRLVSRYPIIQSRSLDGNGAFLIDLGYSKLVYIVAHLPCCENDVQRQQEVDNIMAFVRSVRFGISPFQVPLNTPIIIAGDMNFVGLKQQHHTFLSGDISDNNRYGPDFQPDWDGTDFQAATPITTNTSSTYTWYNDRGTYSPGRLDYFYFSNSVLELKNSFTLWTSSLSNAQLVSSDLRKSDIEDCSDHMPVVCDFFVRSNVSSTFTPNENEKVNISVNTGQLKISSNNDCRCVIYELSGKQVYSCMVDGNTSETTIDLQDVCPVYGIYICQLIFKDQIVSKKIIWL